jgi:hypothetical protein
MQYAPVLDLRSFADRDRVVVGAQDAVEPDAGVMLQDDGADDGRIGGNVVIALADDAAIFERILHQEVLAGGDGCCAAL